MPCWSLGHFKTRLSSRDGRHDRMVIPPIFIVTAIDRSTEILGTTGFSVLPKRKPDLTECLPGAAANDDPSRTPGMAI